MSQASDNAIASGILNRRRYVRESVRIEAQLWSGSFHTSVFLAELAEGGFTVHSSEPLMTGSTVHVSFTLPDSATTLRCDGRVVWSSILEGKAGVEFLRLSDPDHRALAFWLEHYRIKNDSLNSPWQFF